MNATKSPRAKDVIVSNDHSIDHEGTRRFYFVLAKHAEREVRLDQTNLLSSSVLMFSFARAESRFLSRETETDEWKVPSMTAIVSFISDTMDYVRASLKRFTNKQPPQGHFPLVDDCMPWWNKASEDKIVNTVNMNDVIFEDGSTAFGERFKALLDLNREWYHTTRSEIEASVVVDYVINRVVSQGGRFLALVTGGNSDDSWSLLDMTEVAKVVNACLDDTSRDCASVTDDQRTDSQSRQVVEDPSASLCPSPKKTVIETNEDEAVTATGASNQGPTRPLKKRKVHQECDEGLQRPIIVNGRYVSIDSVETGTSSRPLMMIPGCHHSLISMSFDDISMLQQDTRKNTFRPESEELENLGQVVSNPGNADVLLFGHYHSHCGNKRLYAIILGLANYYWQLGSSEKQHRVVLEIIREISNDSGRFVARSHQGWREVKEHIVQKYIERGFAFIKSGHLKPTNIGPSTAARLDITRLREASPGYDAGTHQMTFAPTNTSTPKFVNLVAPESSFVHASRTSQCPTNYGVTQHPGIVPPRDTQPWQVRSTLPSATLSKRKFAEVAAGYSMVRAACNLRLLLQQMPTWHDAVEQCQDQFHTDT